MNILVSTPPLILLGASLGFLFFVIFLQRPDLGLFVVLIARAFSDLSALGRTASGSSALLSPNVGLSILLIVAGGVFMLSRRIPFLSLPGGTLFALLLLTGLVGMLHSENHRESLYQWLRVASEIVPYALAAWLFRTPQRIQGVIDVLAVTFVTPAAFGFYQLVTRKAYYVEGLDILRIRGTFVHSNAFGIFLVVFFSIFFCQAWVQTGTRKLVAIAIVGASLVLMAATYARVSWAGAIIIMMTVGFLSRRPFLLVLPLLVVGIASQVPALSHRVADVPTGESSLGDRLYIWTESYPRWLGATRNYQSGFATALNRLVGAGPAGAEYVTTGVQGEAGAAHNDYLTVLFDYGYIGLFAFLAMYVALLFSAYRTWQATDDPVMRSIALSFFALALAFLVMSSTDNLFAATHSQLYFWTLAGLTVAISRIAREPSSVEDSARQGDLRGERRHGAATAATAPSRGLAVR